MGFDDIIPVIVAIVIFVVSGLANLLNQRNAQRRNPPPAPNQPPTARPRQNPLDDEIGEFLRRAAEKRGGAQRPAARAPGKPELVKAELAPDRARPSPGQRTLATPKPTDFGRRGKELGASVAQADDKVEAHLRQAFDHKLGRLAARDRSPLAATAPPEPLAAPVAPPGLIALLTNPESLQQAIVIGEVLRRPEERWS